MEAHFKIPVELWELVAFIKLRRLAHTTLCLEMSLL